MPSQAPHVWGGEGRGERDVIKASELKPGHKIVTLDGQIHTIRNISRGWYTNSVLIHWAGGWACVSNDMFVESPGQPVAPAEGKST